MAYIPYLLIGANVNYMGVHNLTLGAKDGTPQKKNIQTLKAVFPSWDSDNLADIEMPAEGEDIPQFDLADCYHDDNYTPEGATEPLVKFQAKWFNAPGGGRKAPMTADERKAALAKWKSKFKALAVSSSPAKVAKPALAPEPEPEPELPKAKVAPAPAKKAAVSGPPGRKSTAAVAQTSTQEEVWAGLVAARELPEDDENLINEYYAACDAVVDGAASDPTLLDTPAKWGKVAEQLGI